MSDFPQDMSGSVMKAIPDGWKIEHGYWGKDVFGVENSEGGTLALIGKPDAKRGPRICTSPKHLIACSPGGTFHLTTTIWVDGHAKATISIRWYDGRRKPKGRATIAKIEPTGQWADLAHKVTPPKGARKLSIVIELRGAGWATVRLLGVCRMDRQGG